MRHKRFVYDCAQCERTGLQPDPKAPYKVRVCGQCEGNGYIRMTVSQWIELDRQARAEAS